MKNLESGAFAPTCSRETWVKRQALMARVREFFVRRNALEVETPVLSAYGGTDPQLDNSSGLFCYLKKINTFITEKNI